MHIPTSRRELGVPGFTGSTQQLQPLKGQTLIGSMASWTGGQIRQNGVGAIRWTAKQGFDATWWVLKSGLLFGVDVVDGFARPFYGPIVDNSVFKVAVKVAKFGAFFFAVYTAWQYVYTPFLWTASLLQGPLNAAASHIPGFRNLTSEIATKLNENIAQPILNEVQEWVGEIVGRVKDRLMEVFYTVVMPFWKKLTVGDVVGYGWTFTHFVTKLAFDAGIGIVRNISWQQGAFVTAYLGFLFSVNYGSKVVSELIDYFSLTAKAAIGAPKLTMEFQKAYSLSYPAKLLSSWFSKYTVQPVFNDEVQKQVADIAWRATNSVKSGAALPNILLEGPPGTGKTMVARMIARDSGCNYIVMSGSDIAQYIKRGQHVSEFNKLLEWAKNQFGPTIIFIDEADALCGKRDELDQDHLELQNAFLKETGEASNKIMFALATNRKSNLDTAVLSRMDMKIHVGMPTYTSRVKILTQYFKATFGEDPTWTESKVNRIAAQTAHLTGRALAKLVNALRSAKAMAKGKPLNQDEIDDKVYQFVMQERDLPDTPRSWKVVEVIRDTWLFYIPRMLKVAREIFKDLILFTYDPVPKFKALVGRVRSSAVHQVKVATDTARKLNPLMLFE